MYGITSVREPMRMVIKSTDNGLVHIVDQENIQEVSEQTAMATELFVLKRNELYNELSDNSKNEIQRIIASYAHDVCRGIDDEEDM